MAKKFQFRLEVVKDMRKRARDELTRRVAVQVTEATAARRRLDELSLKEDVEAQFALADRGQKKLDITAMRLQQLYGTWLGRRVEETSSELQRVEAVLAAERTRLAQATARLKAIERLRERRWQRHVVMVRREDQAVTDEVGVRMRQRYGNDPEAPS